MLKHRTKQGFTITELSLSIAFIAVLSISVVLIINNAISSYHRGLTLNKINTAGMDIIDDMRAAVLNSPPRSVEKECAVIYSNGDVQQQCEEDHAHNFVTVARYAPVKIGTRSVSEIPVFGAFCTGRYSYIWNSGYFFTGDSSVEGLDAASLKYKLAGGAGATGPEVKTVSNFKLLKVRDEQHAVCISSILNTDTVTSPEGNYVVSRTGNDSINSGTAKFDITNYNAIDEEPIDILTGDTTSNLAIYNLTSAVPSESNSHSTMFYAASFILGTIQGGINISATGNFCATPNGYNSAIENFDYCAINKFNFAAQAMGG